MNTIKISSRHIMMLGLLFAITASLGLITKMITEITFVYFVSIGMLMGITSVLYYLKSNLKRKKIVI